MSKTHHPTKASKTHPKGWPPAARSQAVGPLSSRQAAGTASTMLKREHPIHADTHKKIHPDHIHDQKTQLQFESSKTPG